MARILIFPVVAATAFVAVAMVHGGSPSAQAHAAGGQAIFEAKCAMCHSPKTSGGPSYGPHLGGIVGRKAGSLPGFHYSQAMKDSGLVWTQANLKRYIASPASVIPGNHMPFSGDHDPNEVDVLVSYLNQL